MTKPDPIYLGRRKIEEAVLDVCTDKQLNLTPGQIVTCLKMVQGFIGEEIENWKETIEAETGLIEELP